MEQRTPPPFLPLFSSKTLFRAILDPEQRGGAITGSPWAPCLHTRAASPLSAPPPEGTRVTADEPALPPSPPRVHGSHRGSPWCRHSVGLHRCVTTCMRHYAVMRSGVPALTTLCAPPTHPPSPTTATTDLSMVPVVLPFPECHVVGNHKACSLFIVQ